MSGVLSKGKSIHLLRVIKASVQSHNRSFGSFIIRLKIHTYIHSLVYKIQIKCHHEINNTHLNELNRQLYCKECLTEVTDQNRLKRGRVVHTLTPSSEVAESEGSRVQLKLH